MKNSKRTQRVIEHFKEIEDLVNYYSKGDKRYTTILTELKQLIIELCEEQKTHDIRLAKKLKAMWGKIGSNNKR
jgi:hypothetical protein